ncbi:MAG: hypothetical protein EA364_02545 [Balneolaceae bacterium]|nr:MAG: hypothetical protein EA364_02545 [Balneolaceae bacterium]
MPEQTHIRLAVYNVIGQHVTLLVDEIRSPGLHHATFNATGLASGLYICRLEAAGHTESRLMMFVK